MMEPQIQYVTTEDGVSIAYYVIGQGPPTLVLISPWSHLEAEWQFDVTRIAYTAAAQQSTLVRLDPRGLGLSDRDPPDFAVESLVRDIEAVVDRLGLEKLRLIAFGFSNMPGMVYTARHPDIVTHLVLTPPAASWADQTHDRLEKLSELISIDWELASETLIRTLNPGMPDQAIIQTTSLLRASVDAATVERMLEDARRWNVDEDATTVTTPTLLIHGRNNPNMSMRGTRRVAGLIKDSRVTFVDTALEVGALAQRFFEGDVPDLTERAPRSVSRPVDSDTMRTILFTDVEGSAALTERLGDAKARDILRGHERLTRESLDAHGGSEVKTMGDGFMASFASASRALECAISMQRSFAMHSEAADEPLSVRIGLNAGEPISENDDLFGTAVNEAARITSIAVGGEILVANVVRELTKGKKFLFNDRGDTSLRGFEDPVRLYEVRWREG